MDTVIANLDGTTAYLDDISVSSKTRKQHEERLYKLFERLSSFGLRARADKCSVLQHEIKYLGFAIEEHGKKPNPEKIAPIVNMPRPQNITQLRAFLGIIAFYNAFVPGMTTL